MSERGVKKYCITYFQVERKQRPENLTFKSISHLSKSSTSPTQHSPWWSSKGSSWKSFAVSSRRASWTWNMPPGFCWTPCWVCSADSLSTCIFDCLCSKTTSSRSRWHPEIQASRLKLHWVERFACFWQKEQTMASPSKCNHEPPFFHESWNSFFHGFFADFQKNNGSLPRRWLKRRHDRRIDRNGTLRFSMQQVTKLKQWLHTYLLLGFGWQRAFGLACGLRPILHAYALLTMFK